MIFLGPAFKQYVIVIVANFSILGLGLGVGWNSPVLVKLQDANQTRLMVPITDDEAAWIVSLAPASGTFTMLVVGYLIDKLGRKYCILLSIIPRFLMCGLNIFATKVWMLYLGRILCGISDVLSLSAVPTYASEIASKEIRGALGTITQILSSIGMLAMLSVGPFVSYFTINIVMIGILIVMFIPQWFLPESPYFLYVKGQKEKSLKLLTHIRGSELKALEEMKEYCSNRTEVNKTQLFKDTTFLKTIGKVLFLSIFFQLIGYNAISAYLQIILESANTTITADMCSPIIGCVQLLACLCAIFLTDRFGRKPLLIVTLIGMAVGLFGLGAFFKVKEYEVEITGLLNYLPLASFMLAIFCFNAGIGSVIWMLIAELFDGPSRGLGVSVGVISTTIFIFLTTRYFSTVTASIGPAATYWVFGGNCIITCIFIILYIPETKGRTFHEIQLSLGRKV